MDRLGQVEGEEHKREAEGRRPSPHPLEAQALSRPFARSNEGEGGAGGDLTRNPQPADSGERELRQLFVRLGGKEEEGVCMALGRRACLCYSPPIQLFPRSWGRPASTLETCTSTDSTHPFNFAIHCLCFPPPPVSTDSNLAPTCPRSALCPAHTLH